MNTEREDLEQGIRYRLEQGDREGAATLAIRGYGAEIYGFLVAFHRDEQDAAEVFSLFNERLWRDLASFRGDSSFRTWAYCLARHASLNYCRDARRRDRRQEPLPADSALTAAVAPARTQTVSYLRTDRRTRFTALRESLPAEDQAILVLRVDRGLAWSDLARVLHQGAQPLGELDLARESARLRKRFQLIKARLQDLGRQAAC